MASAPQYAATATSNSVTISTANTNRDGSTGTYGTVITAGASGHRTDRLSIAATGSTTAGMIRLFVGTSLIREIPVVAVTPSDTQPVWSAEVTFGDEGLALGSGIVLKASTHNAEEFKIVEINGGEF